jgi:hypothetical protein
MTMASLPIFGRAADFGALDQEKSDYLWAEAVEQKKTKGLEKRFSLLQREKFHSLPTRTILIASKLRLGWF